MLIRYFLNQGTVSCKFQNYYLFFFKADESFLTRLLNNKVSSNWKKLTVLMRRRAFAFELQALKGNFREVEE